MAAVLDILSLADGRAAIGRDRTDVEAELDAELELYITATSLWFDKNCGPVVARQIATTAVNTAVRTITLKTPVADVDLDALRAHRNNIAIGSAATGRRIVDIDDDAGTFTVDGRTVTTADNDAVTAGRFATTALVGVNWRIAATAFLRWLWASERGAPSSQFDDTLGAPEVMTVPRRVISLIPEYQPGIA